MLPTERKLGGHHLVTAPIAGIFIAITRAIWLTWTPSAMAWPLQAAVLVSYHPGTYATAWLTKWSCMLRDCAPTVLTTEGKSWVLFPLPSVSTPSPTSVTGKLAGFKAAGTWTESCVCTPRAIGNHQQ